MKYRAILYDNGRYRFQFKSGYLFWPWLESSYPMSRDREFVIQTLNRLNNPVKPKKSKEPKIIEILT